MKEKISSSVSMGRVAYEHDVRNSRDMKNVDYSKSNKNIVLIDKLKNEPGSGVERIYSYTDKKYQKYVDEYNKGKKPCRQIKNGYSEHFNKHQLNAMAAGRPTTQIAYEVVVQMGNHESLGRDFYDNWKMKDGIPQQESFDFLEVYKETLDKIQERFKHLDVLMASIHYDEPNGTPHMHLIFQPDGEGYKKGLNHQVSLSRALANDGFERQEVRSREDYQFARVAKCITEEIMPEIMRANGYEWFNDGHSKGREHIDSKLYPSKAKEAMKSLQNELDEVNTQIQDARNELDDVLELKAQMEGDASKATDDLIQTLEQLDASKALLKKSKHFEQIEREYMDVLDKGL